MPKLRQPPEKGKQESELDQEGNQLDMSGGEDQGDLLQQKEERQDDPTIILQTQLDALKKSEEVQRNRADQAERDRAQAVARNKEREAEIVRFQKEVHESQFDAVNNGLAAAKAEAEKAQQDIENAISLGDGKGQAEAYRRLAKAENAISKMEDGKIELEAKLKEEPKKIAPQIESTIEQSGLPETAKAWLTLHPDYLSDPRKNSKIQALHWDVVDEGHAAFSPAYFESLEQHLGMRQKPQLEEDEDSRESRQTQQRTSIVSAPVSREGNAGNGTKNSSQIRLSPAQREAAKMAGISEKDYALQMQKLADMKANGTYGDRQ